MINKCIFIGHVAADPEIRTAGSDTVANLRIGCSENWTDKNGEKQTTTEWISLVAWRKLAEIIEKYVKKGQLVYVEGKMKTRSWEKDGVKHYTTDVVIDTLKMLGGKKDDAHQQAPAEQTSGDPAQKPKQYVTPSGEDYEDDGHDDLPF